MNAQQLKNSILQEAIEGRLVPQDPNDEPASVLLERIRKEKAKLVKEGLLKKSELKEREIILDEVPFSIPSGWIWTKIDNIAFVTKLAGFEYTKYIAANLVSKDTGIPLFKGKNVQNGKIVYEFESYIPLSLSNELKRSQISKKCLLTPYVGTIGNIGIHDKEGVFHLGSNVGKIEFYNKDNINVLEEYAKYYLMSRYGYQELTKYKKATAQESISIEAIRDVFIPLPPIKEQIEIVEKISTLFSKIEVYGKAQEALDKLNEELPERLKKSVLQEAIEGCLVPQDPNDEPASALLDRIRAEKKRLVKEGKLKKKDLEETPISEDEIPFKIPKSWECVKLSFVTSLLDGEKREGDYVCLDAKYLRGKSTGDILSKGKFVSKKDNIILVDGENSGEVFTVPCDGYMGSTFKQLWVAKSIHLPYVLHFIRFYKDILRNSKKGAAIPHLNKEIFNNLIVGIPPLAEQKRIVEKIEQLLYEIDKLKK